VGFGQAPLASALPLRGLRARLPENVEQAHVTPP
jgi:hypothetical protein